MHAITVEIHFRRAPSVITTREATGVDAAVDQAMRDARSMGWKEPVSKVRVHGPDRYIYPQKTAARLWRLFGDNKNEGRNVIEILELPADGIARQPGFYRMSAQAYHADPAPEPSLSSSAIGTMLERTPRHAYFEHPRLGGMRREGASSAMTLGTVVHALILGAGRELVVIEADSFRTKAAQEQRDAANAAGLTPILRDQYDKAREMSAAALRGLESLPLVGDALTSGRPELVAIWQEDGIWCRSMMDLCPTAPDAEGWWTIHDLKTTQMALDQNTLARHLVSNGYDIQAAHYTRGLEALLGPTARVRFRFLFIESDAPHLCALATCSGQMYATGEQKVLAGHAIWRRGLRDNNWPGYSTELMRLEPPTFMENLWRDREAGDPLIAGALNNWRAAA